jgi:hypothetical protein
MKKIAFFLLVSIVSQTQSKVPSCASPLVVNDTTRIELTDDIVIHGKGTPITAGAQFGKGKKHTVTFHATTPRSIIVKKTGIWDLSSFNGPTKVIEFAGQARLIVEAGAHLIFNDGVLRMSDQSQLIFNGSGN